MSQQQIRVRGAKAEDHAVVTSLVLDLLTELYDPEEWGYSRDTLEPAVRRLLSEGTSWWAFLAYADEGKPAGVITLNQCAAIYAFGRFGEISELYVVPAYRSAGVGATLIEAAVRFGREQGWSLLEVGAPEVPKWRRTVEFYERCGFSVVGPRLTMLLPRSSTA